MLLASKVVNRCVESHAPIPIRSALSVFVKCVFRFDLYFLSRLIDVIEDNNLRGKTGLEACA